jgi:hypothetical protein
MKLHPAIEYYNTTTHSRYKEMRAFREKAMLLEALPPHKNWR